MAEAASIGEKLAAICKQFRLPGELVHWERLTGGKINATYRVDLRQGGELRRYLVQGVNKYVFPDPAAMMENVCRVTRHLRSKAPKDGRPGSLRYYPTAQGDGCLFSSRDGEAEFWRVCDFLANTVTMGPAEQTPRTLTMLGRAFGAFTRQLLDLDPAGMAETIPRFHDTPYRLEVLARAAAEDPLGRAKEAGPELRLILDRRDRAGTLRRQLAQGRLPLRVTHNDTKPANVLLDRDTLEPAAVIDLDTCMPGLTAYDFGDSIRSGACRRETGGRRLDLDLVRAYAEGYLGETAGLLTPAEEDALADGAAVVTLELAARYLTDHLTGDRYFSAHYPGHNLDRAREQLGLFREMEDHGEELRAVIRESGPASGSRAPTQKSADSL